MEIVEVNTAKESFCRFSKNKTRDGLIISRNISLLCYLNHAAKIVSKQILEEKSTRMSYFLNINFSIGQFQRVLSASCKF